MGQSEPVPTPTIPNEENPMDESTTPDPGGSSAETSPPRTPGAAPRPEERPWYLRPSVDIWLGPLLIVACLVLRFGWNGIEGPPFPFWGVAYLLGAAGIFLTYTGWTERAQR
jgi:hypothetical protein